MKKFLFMLCAAVISFCSCSNDDPADPGNNPGGNGALLEEVFKEGTVSEITQTAIFPEGDAEMVTTFAYNGKGFDIKKFTVTHDGKDMTGEIDGKMDYTIERVDNSVVFNYADQGSLTCDMASKTYFIKGYVPAVKSLKINGKEYFPEFTNVTPASEKIDELFKDQSIITIVVPEDDDPTYIYKLELLYYAVTEEYRVKSFIGGETDLTEEAKEFVKAENVDGVFKMTMVPDGTLTIDPVKKTYMREGKISPISDILVNGESIIGQLTEEKPTVSNAYLVFTAA